MRKLFSAVFLLLIISLFCFVSVYASSSSDEAVLGNNRWSVNSSGNLVPIANNSYDIGSSSYKVSTINATTSTITGVSTFQTNLLSNGIANGGASTMASTSTAIPLTYSFVQKQIGNSSTAAITLADGKAGQIIVIECGTLGTGSPTCAITPATCTGFATLTMNAAGDNAALLYVNDSIGWILIGSNSVTVA